MLPSLPFSNSRFDRGYTWDFPPSILTLFLSNDMTWFHLPLTFEWLKFVSAGWLGKKDDYDVSNICVAEFLLLLRRRRQTQTFLDRVNWRKFRLQIEFGKRSRKRWLDSWFNSVVFPAVSVSREVQNNFSPFGVTLRSIVREVDSHKELKVLSMKMEERIVLVKGWERWRKWKTSNHTLTTSWFHWIQGRENWEENRGEDILHFFMLWTEC